MNPPIFGTLAVVVIRFPMEKGSWDKEADGTITVAIFGMFAVVMVRFPMAKGRWGDGARRRTAPSRSRSK